MKDKGLEIVGVNYGDSEAMVKKYVDEFHLSFKIGMSARDAKAPSALYGVRAYPTNYVLDGDGKVVWRGVGFNEAGLRDALAKLGLK
jgi:hypothetical protein